MTRASGRRRIATDGEMVATASVATRNGSGPVGTRVKTTDTSRHRETAPTSWLLRTSALFVLVVMLGAGVGYLGSMLLPTQYAARAEIQYKLSKSVPNELLREDRTLTTQKVLLRSMDVLRPVAQENQMVPEDLAKNISADVVANSEIIDVELRAETRERAQKLLAAVIDRYLVEANRDWEDPVRAYLEGQIKGQQNQLQELQTELQSDISAERADELSQQAKVLENLLNHSQEELSNAPETMSAPPARQLTAPYVVAKQVRPRPLMNAAAGAAAAFVVAALVLLIIARRRLRS
ncbi:hypothetical protein DVS77_15150 [Mycolicibacterium moriokaense]|nr:hypothetical protein DVS77_15150 [Mycolicibacterium moriokaense]